MSYRLVLDENIEHEVLHRLENYGHDAVHVDSLSELGKGTSDDSIAEYSTATDRSIVTRDDDFVLEVDEEEYRAVFYVGDGTLPPERVADVIHEISRHRGHDAVGGLVYVTTDWL